MARNLDFNSKQPGSGALHNVVNDSQDCVLGLLDELFFTS